MGYRYESGNSEQSSGGGALIGLVLVLVATGAALIAYSSFGAADNSAVNVYQSVEYSNQLTGSTTRGQAGTEVDNVTTTSFGKTGAENAGPACNVNACANAYRSFRVADCTFQPFEGPRRLCTRR